MNASPNNPKALGWEALSKSVRPLPFEPAWSCWDLRTLAPYLQCCLVAPYTEQSEAREAIWDCVTESGFVGVSQLSNRIEHPVVCIDQQDGGYHLDIAFPSVPVQLHIPFDAWLYGFNLILDTSVDREHVVESDRVMWFGWDNGPASLTGSGVLLEQHADPCEAIQSYCERSSHSGWVGWIEHSSHEGARRAGWGWSRDQSTLNFQHEATLYRVIVEAVYSL